MAKKQLDEKVSVGGGATGVSEVPTPADKNATLPASKLGNGEPMKKIDDPNHPGEEETSTENNVKATKDTAGSNKATLNMKPSDAQAGQSYSFVPNSVKEDIDAMFSGSELSEEFKEKATTIFEAAVVAKVNEAVAELEEQYNTALAEEVARVEEEMTSKIDQYMDYVAEQWLEQNKVAVEASLRTEITESFINDLKSLFEQHNINVPEDKFEVVDELRDEVAEVQARLDQVMEENMSLKKDLSEATRAKILADVAEGLAATQAEKLTALAEGVEFDTAESYRKKLEIVKENYFPSEKPVAGGAKALMEQVEEGSEQPASAPANSPVSFYAQAISRTVKK